MTATIQATGHQCHFPIKDPYQTKKCGICEKEGGEILWPNHTSRYAHRICYLRINPIQTKLIREILELFESAPNPEKSRAHARAVTAVRRACKTTILEFLEKHGSDALKKIFDTIGLRAATQRYAKY